MVVPLNILFCQILSEFSSPPVLHPYEKLETASYGSFNLFQNTIEQVPDILTNPGSLAFLKSAKAYSVVHSGIDELSLEPDTSEHIPEDTLTSSSSPRYALKYFSFAIPFTMLGKPWSIGISFHGHLLPGPATHVFTWTRGRRYFSWKHNWNTSAISAGLGTRLSQRIGIGLGITRWFGVNRSIFVRQERYDDQVLEYSTYGTYRYTRHYFNLGLVARLKQFHFEFGIYPPVELMEGDHVYSYEHPDFNYIPLRQKYAGAIRFGIADNINPDWTIGSSYLYQGQVTTIRRVGRWQEQSQTYTSSPSARLLLGTEYRLTVAETQVSLRLAYLAHWMSTTETSVYRDVTVEGESRLSSSLILGIGIVRGPIGLHARGRVSNYPIKLLVYSPFDDA
jgi:hypothetical protein